MKHPTKPLALVAGIFAAAATSAFAQSTTAEQTRSPADANNEQPVALSPFIVSTNEDTGYAAVETLSGTRLRTNLRDVGAALTVLTPQFLQDLGVNSFDQALLYTPSVNEYQGDLSDVNRQSGNQVRYDMGQTYSIRGFVTNTGGQSISHDFFSALEPTDNYNVERTTLSLGPNALLIGVGNPQGAVVTSTKRALLNRRKTEVQLQTDRWGSQRIAVDHNQPLIKDKLALRINLLHDAHREFRRFEGKNQERITLGLTAKPFAKTLITLNHESYSIGANVGSLVWGFDGTTLRWLAAGKPTVDFPANGQRWTPAQHQSFDPNNFLGQQLSNVQTWVVGLDLPNPVVNTRYQGQFGSVAFGGLYGANYMNENPWALFGLSKDTNLNSGTWRDPSQKLHGRWTELLVQQELAPDLYLELGANFAAMHRTLDPNTFNNIRLDPNRYLPDGTVNPGYLVPYADSQMQLRWFKNQNTDLRATLSYQLDLTKYNRWFGAHNFAVLAQTSRADQFQDLTRIFNLATVGIPGNGWSSNGTDNQNVMYSTVYFLHGNVPTLPDSIQLQNAIPILNRYHLIGATANEAQPINLKREDFLNAINSRFDAHTLSFGWQGKWLHDHLVTVAGVRRDDTWSYGNPTVRNVVEPGIPNAASVPLEQYFALAQTLPFNSQPSVVARGITRTESVVLHTLPWLDLYYNRSANFLPVTNASLVDFLGRPAPNSKGKTEESGVRFYLFQSRLSIGVDHFKTSADNQARNAYGNAVYAANILNRLQTNYKVQGDSHFQDMAAFGSYPVETGNVSDTWSYVAQGYEVNIIANPSPNWRLALNGSINTNQLGTHLAALGQYIHTNTKYEGLGTWRTFASELNKVAAGQASSYFDLNPSSPAAQTQAAADALYITQQANTLEQTYGDNIALTGITTNEDGKYAANGVVTRAFNTGWLKGWSVGGNFRWRSANVIGYERLPGPTGAPTGIIDVTKPLKGAAFWDVGMMVSYQTRLSRHLGLRVQLNVDNLPNWQSPRLLKADYDTNAVYGTTNAIVPVLYTLRRPRNFVLTTTFLY